MGVDLIVIRHPNSGAPQMLAQNVRIRVVNAGDGMHEHPTQALLDIFTIMEKKGDLRGLKIAIVGDIYHSRVARSNIWGLLKMGAKVTLAGPSTLIPLGIRELGVSVADSVKEGIYDADVVMNLRLQLERQKSAFFPSSSEYGKFFGMNEEVFHYAKKDALIMHPGPVNRGLELQSSLMEGQSSLIDEQVQNGVAVRMAILELMLGGEIN
jgi:aspartate carbamoyltransferase catalytic subunit